MPEVLLCLTTFLWMSMWWRLRLTRTFVRRLRWLICLSCMRPVPNITWQQPSRSDPNRWPSVILNWSHPAKSRTGMSLFRYRMLMFSCTQILQRKMKKGLALLRRSVRNQEFTLWYLILDSTGLLWMLLATPKEKNESPSKKAKTTFNSNLKNKK
jgi:hypothetical protein